MARAERVQRYARAIATEHLAERVDRGGPDVPVRIVELLGEDRLARGRAGEAEVHDRVGANVRIRLAIGSDALEEPELAGEAQAGQRADAQVRGASERDALEAPIDLLCLVTRQRGQQATECLDGGRRQLARGLVVGLRIEQRLQVIERAAIAERAEREESAIALDALACLGDEEQRLERLGTLARGEAERRGEHQLAATTAQRGLERRERGRRYVLGAQRERLGSGGAHRRVAIGEQLVEDDLRAAVVDVAERDRHGLAHDDDRRARRVGERGERHRLAVALARAPVGQRARLGGPVAQDHLQRRERVRRFQLERALLASGDVEDQPRQRRDRVGMPEPAQRAEQRVAIRGAVGIVVDPRADRVAGGRRGLRLVGETDERLDRFVDVVLVAEEAGEHVDAEAVALARESDGRAQAEVGVLARERGDQRVGDRGRRFGRGRELADRGEADVTVLALRGEELRLGAARRVQLGQAHLRVRARVAVVGVERRAHERGRAVVSLERERDELVDRGLAEIRGARDRLRERRERADRVQRAQGRHRRLAHEVVRIADRVTEHRQHRVHAHGILARELGEPADSIAPHAMRLVGGALVRRLAHEARVHAEHEALRGRRVDAVCIAGADEQARDRLELGGLRIAAIADEAAEPPALAGHACLRGPRGHGRRCTTRRSREALRFLPERERLRTHREHLRGRVAQTGLIRGDRVGEDHEDLRATRGRRPVLHVGGLLGLARPDDLADHLGVHRLARGAPLEQARGSEPDLWRGRRHRVDEQIGRDARRGERGVARDDHREREVLDLAIAILQALAQAAHAVGSERDEADDRADAQRAMIVALRTGEHRQRAQIAELGKALAAPRAHGKIRVAEQAEQAEQRGECLLVADGGRGRDTAGTHLAHE